MRAYLETLARRTVREHPFNGCRRLLPLLPLLAGVLRKRSAGVIVEADATARADTAYVLAEAGAFAAVRAAARTGRAGEPVRGRAGRAARTRAGPAVSAFRAHRCLGGGGDGGCPFGLRPWALPPLSELPGEPPRPAPCPGRGSAGFLMGVLFSLPTGCLPCSARLLTAWFMTLMTVTAQACGYCARRAAIRRSPPSRGSSHRDVTAGGPGRRRRGSGRGSASFCRARAVLLRSRTCPTVSAADIVLARPGLCPHVRRDVGRHVLRVHQVQPVKVFQVRCSGLPGGAACAVAWLVHRWSS